MNDAIQFLLDHGYTLLFVAVLAQQLGLPLPSTPFILAAGALTHQGRMSFATAVLTALLATLLADLLWFEVGRRRGMRVLHFLCRISLEPDYCVRRTENSFAKHGAKTLLVAKLVPGISALATPLAGINGLPVHRFLVYDAGGALLWIVSFTALGYLFSDQLEDVVSYSARFGSLALALVVLLFVLWIAWKYFQRRRFIRSLRVARIAPEILKQMIDRGDEVFVVDLRHTLDYDVEPRTIPGALRLPVEEFERRGGELPVDRELVLFCT